jgi:hypothetical protein
MRLLEPSFGGGDFLLSAISRLLAAWRNASKSEKNIDKLGNAIRAVEIHRESFTSTYKLVVERIKQEGINARSAAMLADQWLVQGDFLLVHHTGKSDFVVGNPPYVRHELIPSSLSAEYRKRYPTMYDRADLYIPFIERALSLLAEHGSLGFICADRWLKNKYGGPLREHIGSKFHLKAYVNMINTPAFHSEVSAYPAIIVISREKPGATRIAQAPRVNYQALSQLSVGLLSPNLPIGDDAIWEVSKVANGSEPWLFESSRQMGIIRHLERLFPSLEQTGCKVGIGVATGADKAFIGDYESLDVEEDRKLPLVTTRDITSAEVRWQGKGIINPFSEDGRLVNLKDYPRLSSYLTARKELIVARHCARKSPLNWYRTIDRIRRSLTYEPKLLIPDIKGSAHIVFEKGELYPHHNLYFVTSTEWDLRALQAVLLSRVTRLFIETYSTKMRGGYLRFQAQYLRRIRIPYWQDVSEDLRERLIHAAIKRDLYACDQAAFDLYGIRQSEQLYLAENGGDKHGSSSC